MDKFKSDCVGIIAVRQDDEKEFTLRNNFVT